MLLALGNTCICFEIDPLPVLRCVYVERDSGLINGTELHRVVSVFNTECGNNDIKFHCVVMTSH